MKRHVVLVGYRASGKTTVARLLARRLQCEWIDADAALEQEVGRSIPDIFAAEGESAFRSYESTTLQRLIADPVPQIIATGGGCVIASENRELLSDKTRCYTFYLDVPVEVIQERLSLASGNRPSLSGQSIVDEVPGILAQRTPWYREVAHTVIPYEETPQQVVEALLIHLAGDVENQDAE